MKESALVTRILRDLHAAGAKAIKIHGSPFTEAGTPDIVGSFRGRAFVIECKVDRNQTTPIQEARMTEWRLAGAVSLVAREDWTVARLWEALHG